MTLFHEIEQLKVVGVRCMLIRSNTNPIEAVCSKIVDYSKKSPRIFALRLLNQYRNCTDEIGKIEFVVCLHFQENSIPICSEYFINNPKLPAPQCGHVIKRSSPVLITSGMLQCMPNNPMPSKLYTTNLKVKTDPFKHRDKGLTKYELFKVNGVVLKIYVTGSITWSNNTSASSHHYILS